jgi:hypothetical protein
MTGRQLVVNGTVYHRKVLKHTRLKTYLGIRKRVRILANNTIFISMVPIAYFLPLS